MTFTIILDVPPYHHREWNCQPKFKSWIRLLVFHSMLISMFFLPVMGK